MKIVVVGAGVFGAWCAWFLSERGHLVTLIDQYGPANARASSADHSRVIRAGYGADEIYSRWARASLDDWRALEQRCGRELLLQTGALFLGAADDHYILATRETLARLDIAADALESTTLRDRFPQIEPTGLGTTLFEANAGVIRARSAVQALVRWMIDNARVRYRVARIAAVDESAANVSIHDVAGVAVEADAYVFACGPWLPSLFPQAVGARIRPTRQEVLHFGVPPGDDRYSLAKLPVWIDFSAGLYGIPDFDGRGFKVGIDRHGPSLDPDTYDRMLRPDVVARTRTWLAQRFPGLAKAPLLDGHVCQYENTHTGDFIIDRHPAHANVWIVGGGSGHGFKHGPAVGRFLAERMLAGGAAEQRFGLAGKGTSAARAVY